MTILKGVTLPFGRHLLAMQLIRRPSVPIDGIASRTEDGRHVLFLDYDDVDPVVVKADLENVRRLVGPLAWAWLKTWEKEDESGIHGNYHVVVFNKFSFWEAYALLAQCHADVLHRELATRSRFRAWVLRTSPKGRRAGPELVCYGIDGSRPRQELSSAHWQFYLGHRRDWKTILEHPRLCWDRKTKIWVTHYQTASKVDLR